MKKLTVSISLFISSLTISGMSVYAYAADVNAAPPGTCAAKIHEIEQQLEQARRHRNTGQIHGLETALHNAKTYCQDNDLRLKRQQNVAEKQAKVAEREAELRESQQSGADASKIQKRREKLAKAQQDLHAAQQEMAAADGQ